MSKENAVRFLKEMVTNEQAKKLLQAKAPKNAEESLKAYVEIAAELGQEISEEDFAAAREELEAEISRKSQNASEEMMELDDDDVEDVAGGTRGHPLEWCMSDFFCVAFSYFPCTWAEIAICSNSEH